MKFLGKGITASLLVLAFACGKEAPQESKPGLAQPLFQPMEWKHLPDLQVPRADASIFLLNGEPTLIGGHTTGFLPVSSAEYFSKGRWNKVEGLYPMDAAACTQLSSGKVLVAGGYESGFGIGQSWGVQLYDPSAHAFSSLPVMSQKRANASARELPDGRVVISGNWYFSDGIESYMFQAEPPVPQAVSGPRAVPYILPTASDNALILGPIDEHGNPVSPLVADELDGTSFPVQLPPGWQLRPCLSQADLSVGEGAWLLPARDSLDGPALLLLRETAFSPVSLHPELPVESPWGTIRWEETLLQTEPQRKLAWIPGWLSAGTGVLFLARVNYSSVLAGGDAEVYLFVASAVPDLPEVAGILPLPDGRILLPGGKRPNTNYDARKECFAFYPGVPVKASGLPAWVFWLLLSLVAIAVLWGIGHRGPKKKAPEASEVPEKALLDRIVALMEEEQLFRRRGLLVKDVAELLHTNSTYVSACLNTQLGKSFPDFVNGYRVRYAQQLMREHPSMGFAQISEESGFSGENAFFRTFKAHTGVTPSAWKSGL